ncbi:MAG TPA: hypothetical protein VIH35_09030 [Kiritimatiellia bacterium]
MSRTWMALVLALAALAMGPAGPARAAESNTLTLAIVDLTTNKTCGDLLFDALAQRSDIRLVEREQMARILQEQALSAAGDAVKLGKLVGAEGLIFLEDEADLIHIRLVETARGVRLFDGVSPASGGAGALLDDFLSRAARFVPKLLLDEGDRHYVAVLPFDRATSTNVAIQALDALHTLVGIHLSSATNVFLVEREHLGDVEAEDEISGSDEQVLRTASCSVRGRIVPLSGNRVRVEAQLRRGLDAQVVALSTENEATNRSALAEALAAAVLARLGTSAGAGPASLREEAALYFRNGRTYLEHRNIPAALQNLSVALLLEPGEPDGAAEMMDAASRQLEADGSILWNTPKRLSTRTYVRDMNYFGEACRSALRSGIKITRLPSDSAYTVWGAHRPDLSARDQSDVQQVRVAFRAAAEAAHASAPPASSGKALRYIATSFPFFFEDPREALEYLRRLAEQPGFPWETLRDARFNDVRYWDTNSAAQLWSGYLDELMASDDPQRQFAACMSACYRDKAFEQRAPGRRAGPRAMSSASNLFAWIVADPRHLDWVRTNAREYEKQMLWYPLSYVDDATQASLFDHVMMPLALDARKGLGGATYFLSVEFNRRGGLDMLPADRAYLTGLLDKAMRTASQMGPGRAEDVRARNAGQEWYRALSTEPTQSAEPLFPDIPGGALVFDSNQIDAGVRPVFDASGVAIDEQAVWIGWAVSGAIRVARAPLDGGPVEAWTVPGEPSECSGGCEPTPLARIGAYLAVPGSTTLTFVPVRNEAPWLVPGDAVVLGPEIGGVEMGHIARRGETRISMLAGSDDGIYIGLATEVGEGGHSVVRGSLVRWKPGGITCEVLCASDALEPGPFNDCTPYSFVRAWDDDPSRLYFAVAKASPGGHTNEPLPGVWSYEPSASKWAYCSPGDFDLRGRGRAPDDRFTDNGDSAWYVNFRMDGLTRHVDLMRKTNELRGAPATVFSVPDLDFHIAHVIAWKNGLYVCLSCKRRTDGSSDRRGLVYRIPVPES